MYDCLHDLQQHQIRLTDVNRVGWQELSKSHLHPMIYTAVHFNDNQPPQTKIWTRYCILAVYCVTLAESGPYCHSRMSRCLFVCPRQRTLPAGRASRRCCCCIAAAGCCVAAVRSRQDSGSRQTLLVLQFLFEFANIWAQYSPSTYASTHVSFFWFVP